MIVPATVPGIIQRLFPRRVWQIAEKEKVAYISFDDGPHERITPIVLQMLDRYGAKASFFCIGDRVHKHPECFAEITAAGHAVGNHTQHHLNGWKTDTDQYLEDVRKADEKIGSKMFRPPYGRMTGKQFRKLEAEGYSIIMWTILSGDYDRQLSPESCAQRVLKNLRPGSIILFHDSEKAEKKHVLCT